MLKHQKTPVITRYSKVKVSRDRPRWPQGVPGRLRPRIFFTFQHYKGGRSSAKCTGHLYPRRNPWYSLSEAELTSGHMVLSGVPWKKSPLKPPGINPGTVGLVAQCLNHYATPDPDHQIQLAFNSVSWRLRCHLNFSTLHHTLFKAIIQLQRVNPLFNQQLKEVILPHIQNIVGICKKTITLLILHQVSSRSVTCLNL